MKIMGYEYIFVNFYSEWRNWEYVSKMSEKTKQRGKQVATVNSKKASRPRNEMLII